MRPRVPRQVWDAVRVLSVAAALALAASLFVAPENGLDLLWKVAIPLLPIVFFVAPGLWRNVCPLAAANQVPRRLGFTRGRSLPAPLREYGFLVAVALLFALVPARKLLFETSGAALALLLLGALGAAFVGGLVFRGKSGWCTTFCPLLPVQRLYGQTPFTVVRNSHCEPCIGCTTQCYDFNPRVAELADLHGHDELRSGSRRLFAAGFPGFVLGFFVLDAGSGWEDALVLYGTLGLFVLGSVGSFSVLDSLLKVRTTTLAVVFAAAALNVFYWYALPPLVEELAGTAPEWLLWPARAALLALSLVWIQRSRAKDEHFLLASAAPVPVRVGAGGEAALHEASRDERPEVVIPAHDRRIAVAPGWTLLETVERAGLPIEAGCRMGVCGADPIEVVEGMDNLSPITDEERATLERLGLAESTRMACCARVAGSVTLSLTPSRRSAATTAATAPADPSIRRVVVIGNGIAGVTAADFVRRGHSECEIDVVGREAHQLYNRMAITRLVYGHSGMQGLYLLPDAWYDEQRVTCWLNTRATAIDREARTVVLATGETLPYDRLILAMGSKGYVPPVEGFGAPGAFALRDAEDAIRLRAFVQEYGCRSAIVAGGGLLGLESAYALHRFGLRVTVLERSEWLLRRQLDERGAHYLARYLEGLGLEYVTGAELTAIELADGRVAGAALTDGRVFATEAIVVSAGIEPNVELARAAGLSVNRGVVVDDELRTSDPDVFAVGDVAEHRGSVAGLWPAAVEQAKVAAANAIGGSERFEGSLSVTILKVTGVELTSVGRFDAGPEEEEIVVEDPIESRYRKLVVDDGVAVGGILLGYPQEAAGLTAAVRERRDLSTELDRLRAGDWSSFGSAGLVTSEAAA